MKILSLNIKEFAGITDLSLDFIDGINVIEGLNESGKSTINAFIKFALYGLDNSKCHDTSITEKKYYTSWRNGIAQGSLTVSHNKKNYRIERKGTLGATYRESCDIYDLESGAKVFKGREPGEIFLGIAAPVFESTCCVRQRELTEVDGRGVSDAIQNMLISADKNINLDRASKKLNDVRKSLLLQKGEGGRISELSREIDGLKVRLDRAEKASKDIRLQRDLAASKSAMVSDLRTSLTKASEKLAAFDSVSVLKKFDELHETENEISKVKKAIDALDKSFNNGQALPDRDAEETLVGYGRRIPGAAADYERARTVLDTQKNVPAPDALKVRAADKIISCGGVESVLTVYSSYRKTIKALLITAIILMSFGVAALAASILLGILLSPFIFIGTALGAGLIATAVVLFVKRVGKKKKMAAYLERAGYFKSDIPEIFVLDSYLSECVKAKREEQKRKEIIDAAEKACESKRIYLEGVLKEALETLKIYHSAPLPSCEYGSCGEIIEIIDETVTSVREFIAKREKLNSELLFKERVLLSLRDTLSGKDEEFIRRNLSPELIEEVKDLRRENLAISRDYLSEQIKGVDHAREDAEKRLISLESSSEDPIGIACRIEEKQAELSRLKVSYDALLLAMQTIESAGVSLRQGITPRLCRGAADRMAMLTDGKYDGLSVDSNASLSITTDMTRDIGVLSAGTRDAAYLSLRFSMIDIIFGETKPCITIDEGLSQLDDIRARSMLNVLKSYCQDGGQCILFTCHGREERILSELCMEHQTLRLA